MTAWVANAAAAAMVLAAASSAGTRDSPTTMEVPAVTYPSYYPTKYTPAIGDDERALRLAMEERDGRTVFRPDEPWPLFGAYRVGRDILEEFGRDPSRHVLLVLRRKDPDELFFGLILKDIPLNSPGSVKGEKGGITISVGQTFAVDLKVQCRIPPRPGKYWVVAILGKLASNVVEFEVR